MRVAEATGRDMLAAARMVKPGEPLVANSIATIAVMTLVDGQPLNYEDALQLSARDLNALARALDLENNPVPSPAPESSPASSDSDSGSAS